MHFRDIRQFIEFLETKGELRRVKTAVSCDLEITEIADRVSKTGGPALLFENVEGYGIPVLINAYGSMQRIAWALGVDHIESLGDNIRSLLDLLEGPPKGILDKLRTLGQLRKMASFQPKMLRNAPCQEVVLTGDQVNLDRFPILKCWPMDGGRTITLPMVVTRDPETGSRNVGTYRIQVYDQRTTGMHWQAHKVGTHHMRIAQEMGKPRIDVAVALGGDPATLWTGSAPLPPDMDEMLVAGVLRKESVKLVKCKTVDLEVPAFAEIILEGYVDPNELRLEGPFGDHTGYYSPKEPYPVFHVTAVTHRHHPIYVTTIVGRPPMEDYYMGKATERLFLPIIQKLLPEVMDINMPAEGVFHNLVIISIKKEYPGHARKVAYALWGLGLMMLAKTIIVVDHYVDVQNLSEVAWRVTNNIDPSHDVMFAAGPLDDLDHAGDRPKYGSKMGIDATAKGILDGRTREWPPDIEMSDTMKTMVDSKWADYGI